MCGRVHLQQDAPSVVRRHSASRHFNFQVWRYPRWSILSRRKSVLSKLPHWVLLSRSCECNTKSQIASRNSQTISDMHAFCVGLFSLPVGLSQWTRYRQDQVHRPSYILTLDMLTLPHTHCCHRQPKSFARKACFVLTRPKHPKSFVNAALQVPQNCGEMNMVSSSLGSFSSSLLCTS